MLWFQVTALVPPFSLCCPHNPHPFLGLVSVCPLFTEELGEPGFLPCWSCHCSPAEPLGHWRSSPSVPSDTGVSTETMPDTPDLGLSASITVRKPIFAVYTTYSGYFIVAAQADICLSFSCHFPQLLFQPQWSFRSFGTNPRTFGHYSLAGSTPLSPQPHTQRMTGSPHANLLNVTARCGRLSRFLLFTQLISNFSSLESLTLFVIHIITSLCCTLFLIQFY